MDAVKRREPEDGSGERALVLKRAKTDLVVADNAGGGALIAAGPRRTSGLLAPIMLLSGHEAEIYTLKFNPDGKTLATGSFDKTLRIWNVYGGCENTTVMKGHGSAVLDVQWASDGSYLFTASADKSGGVWDVEQAKRVKKLAEHTSIVNSVSATRRGTNPLIITGSDDGTVKLWDVRVRGSVQTFHNKYQVLSVAFSDNGEQFFAGGLDNDIKVWDIRSNEVIMKMVGHTDSITSVSLSPDGSYVASYSMDNLIRIWDVRPFFSGTNRCVKMLQGPVHGIEKNLLKLNWSPDGSKLAAGSGTSPSGHLVYVWDTASRNILYALPGHTGAVNEVAFHPTEPIIGSCSADKNIYLGEIEP